MTYFTPTRPKKVPPIIDWRSRDHFSLWGNKKPLLTKLHRWKLGAAFYVRPASTLPPSALENEFLAAASSDAPRAPRQAAGALSRRRAPLEARRPPPPSRPLCRTQSGRKSKDLFCSHEAGCGGVQHTRVLELCESWKRKGGSRAFARAQNLFGGLYRCPKGLNFPSNCVF